MTKALGPFLISTLALLLAPCAKANPITYTLCPNAAVSNVTLTPVAGPLDSTCGSSSAVVMSVADDTDEGVLGWNSYPAGLALGNLAGASAGVSNLSGGQPYYQLFFTDASDALTPTGDDILMIEFPGPFVSGGNTMTLDPATTQFNVLDFDTGNYLNVGPNQAEGGQQDTDSLDGWLSLFPSLAGDSTQIWMAIGLDGSDTGSESVTLDSLDITENQSASTPEPGSLLLLGTGMLGFGRLIRRKITSQIATP